MRVFQRESLDFFLGGYDLEMITIRDLLQEAQAGRVWDKKLFWGARCSDYSQEIKQSLHQNRTPVLIELENDLNLDADRIILVDHHGTLAGSDTPTSLHQVFKLLGFPQSRWTRWLDLVAANDQGYIPELLKLKATPEEIALIRSADRAAQGISEAEERAGEEAITEAVRLANDSLTVVHLPHSKTAVVTDRLHPALGGAGYTNLLVISPSEVNFFGCGEAIYRLDKLFSGGWYGGALPGEGFWGIAERPPNIIALVLDSLSASLSGES